MLVSAANQSHTCKALPQATAHGARTTGFCFVGFHVGFQLSGRSSWERYRLSSTLASKLLSNGPDAPGGPSPVGRLPGSMLGSTLTHRETQRLEDFDPWLWRPEAPPAPSAVGSSKGLPRGHVESNLEPVMCPRGFGARGFGARRFWPEVFPGKATMRKWKMLPLWWVNGKSICITYKKLKINISFEYMFLFTLYVLNMFSMCL